MKISVYESELYTIRLDYESRTFGQFYTEEYGIEVPDTLVEEFKAIEAKYFEMVDALRQLKDVAEEKGS